MEEVDELDVMTFHPNLIYTNQLADREPVFFEIFSNGVLFLSNGNRLKFCWFVKSSKKSDELRSSKSKVSKQTTKQRFSTRTHRFGELQVFAWNLTAFDPKHELILLYSESSWVTGSGTCYFSFITPSDDSIVKIPVEMNNLRNSKRILSFGKYLLAHNKNTVNIFSKEALLEAYKSQSNDCVLCLHTFVVPSICSIGVFWQHQLWIGESSGIIDVFDLNEHWEQITHHTPTKILRKHSGSVTGLCQWGELVASSGDDATIALWNRSWACVKLIGTGYIPSNHTVLCICTWKEFLCTATFDNMIKCWNKEGECVASVPVKKKIRYLGVWKHYLCSLDCTSSFNLYQGLWCDI